MTPRMPTFGHPLADAAAGLVAFLIVVFALCLFDLPHWVRRAKRRGG